MRLAAKSFPILVKIVRNLRVLVYGKTLSDRLARILPSVSLNHAARAPPALTDAVWTPFARIVAA